MGREVADADDDVFPVLTPMHVPEPAENEGDLDAEEGLCRVPDDEIVESNSLDGDPDLSYPPRRAPVVQSQYLAPEGVIILPSRLSNTTIISASCHLGVSPGS